MSKQIVKLGVDPFHIGLADQACSVFVDPRSGDILLDEGEGEGEGRLNGVVLYADKEPRFYSIPLPEAGAQLLLSYRKHLLVLGSHSNATELMSWVRSANEFLAAKGVAQHRSTEPIPNPADNTVSTDFEYSLSMASVAGMPYCTYAAAPRQPRSLPKRSIPWTPSRSSANGGFQITTSRSWESCVAMPKADCGFR